MKSMLDISLFLERGKDMRSHMITAVESLKVFTLLLTLTSFVTLSACGSSKSSPYAGEVCRQGVKILKKRVGPEFNKLISITPLPIAPPERYGCVFTYTTVLEELPGEVQGEFVSSMEGHELAFVMPDSENRLILNLAQRPLNRSGSVEMLVKLAELHAEGLPEIMVEERTIGSRDSIYNLRIFMYADGVPVPKEIFSERMSIKLDSGIERPAELLLGEFEGNPTIFLKSPVRNQDRVYMWDESLQTYRFDLSATQRRSLSGTASQQKVNPTQKQEPKSLNQNQAAGSSPSSLVGLLDKDASKTPSSDEQKSSQALPKEKAEDKMNKERAEEPQVEGTQEKNVTTVNEFLEGL